MSRRSFDEVRTEAIVAERAGVLALAKTERVAIDALVRGGKCGPDEGALLNDRICAFADKIAAGFHRDTEDSRVVRDRVRRIQRAMIKGDA